MSRDMGQVSRHNGIRNLSPPGRGDEGGGKASRIKNGAVLLTRIFFFLSKYIFLNWALARTLPKTLSLMDTSMANKIP